MGSYPSSKSNSSALRHMVSLDFYSYVYFKPQNKMRMQHENIFKALVPFQTANRHGNRFKHERQTPWRAQSSLLWPKLTLKHSLVHLAIKTRGKPEVCACKCHENKQATRCQTKQHNLHISFTWLRLISGRIIYRAINK